MTRDEGEFVMLALGRVLAEQQRTNRLLEELVARLAKAPPA